MGGKTIPDYISSIITGQAMGWKNTERVILFISLGINLSCGVLQKSSQHGFGSGYYKHRVDDAPTEKVYLNIEEDHVAVYPVVNDSVEKPNLVLPLGTADSLVTIPSRFTKQSLDIDITSILLKYRPKTDQLPPQLSAELNVALYAGWRHDYYRIKSKKDPIGKVRYDVVSRGWDVGILGGAGTTMIGPSTTTSAINREYNAMILQLGVAAFLETGFASFGVATGYDYLVGDDRDVWIYHRKPWVGFVVGIALN